MQSIASIALLLEERWWPSENGNVMGSDSRDVRILAGIAGTLM